MERVVLADEDCWVVKFHVRPDQQVDRGFPLFDIMSDGRVETIRSIDRGFIEPVDGKPFFMEAFHDPKSWCFKKGMPIVRITHRTDGKEAGKIRGCTPRPTSVIRRRNERKFALN